MRTVILFNPLILLTLSLLARTSLTAQELPPARPADAAFEAGDWAAAIESYRQLLDASSADGTTWLRIAQAQRGLERHEAALESLERAREFQGPEAMIDLERARNFASLGERSLALGALEASDHLGLRALSSLEEAGEFDALRRSPRFERVYGSVRARIYPCEQLDGLDAFDFWLGSWEVRAPDGTLVGHSTVSKRDGGCAVEERWDGAGGSSGTSVNFYLPSRDQWRQVWAGSGGTLIDMVGGPTEDGMRLEGTIEYAQPNRVLAFRGSWTLLEDGSVRQHLEEFSLVAQGWVTWFEGFYRSTASR